MTEKQERISVTARAVIQRINRRIKPGRQRLLAARGNRDEAQTGHYYLVSTETGRLIETHIDLEKLARREHALELWEELEPKEGEA